MVVVLALLGAGCRTKASEERQRAADSVVAAEQQGGEVGAPAVPWQRAEAVPHLRLDGATAVLGDTVYLIGGVGPGDTLSAITTVDRFDQVGKVWSDGPALPRALSHIQAAVVGDSAIWIAGGFLGRHGGPPSAEVWRLDRRSGGWVAGPALPEARGGGALVAIGDTLYYAGGWGADRVTDRGTLWQLLPRATSWRARASMPLPRGDAAAVAHDGRLLLFGGQQSHDLTPVDLNDAWAYEPRTDRWSELPPMPATRSHIGAAAVRWGAWVLLPGGGDLGAGRRFSDDLLGFDTGRNVWRRLAPLPIRLRGGNGWLRGDTLQLAGGAEVNNAPSNANRWVRALRRVWMELPGEGPKVREAQATVAGDVLFLFGERQRTGWGYDLSRGRWSADDNLPNRPRQGEIHALAADGRRVALLGGTSLTDSVTLLQQFIPELRRWTVMGPIPSGIKTPRLHYAADSWWLVGDPRYDRETRQYIAAVVFRRDPDGHWDSVSVVPLTRFRPVVVGDARSLCLIGGAGPVQSWEPSLQCLDLVSMRWRTTDAGDFPVIPVYLAEPKDGAMVEGRPMAFGWHAQVFDPARRAWDSLPVQPIEARSGVVTSDGDRVLHYSARTGRVWMMWP